MWWFAVATAAEFDAYPRMAEVTLPEKGVVRLRVPPELRSWADPEDGSDLLLVDADGHAVPTARIEGPQRHDDERHELSFAPLEESGRFTVDVGSFRVDAFIVSFNEGHYTVSGSVWQDGVRMAGPSLLWRAGGTRGPSLPVPALSGEVTLELLPVGTTQSVPDLEAIVGLRSLSSGVPDDVVDVAVGPPILGEDEVVLYALLTDAPMPFDRLLVGTDAPNFQRDAEVVAIADGRNHGHGHGMTEPTTIRRSSVAGEVMESLALPVPHGLRYHLLIDAHGAAPLPVQSAQLQMDGVQLIVSDPGPGPHTLYGGAVEGSTAAWDLSAATAELVRAPAETVEPGATHANPAWVPQEVRSGLAAVSTPLDLRGMRWARDIQGSPGPARIPVPLGVVADARSGLADLRVMSSGHRVPHFVRSQPSPLEIEEARWERSEDGGVSRFAVTLPHERMHVDNVVLTTSAQLFDRRVTVLTPDGATLRPIRTTRWVGGARPGRVAVQVRSMTPGQVLVIEIDNGDDPPLPIDGVFVFGDGYEVVTVIPEGGAQVVYGDPSRGEPVYDLSRLRGAMRLRDLPVATLGEAWEVQPPALSLADRAVLAVGLGVLGLGLLGVLLELLRRQEQNMGEE